MSSWCQSGEWWSGWLAIQIKRLWLWWGQTRYPVNVWGFVVVDGLCEGKCSLKAQPRTHTATHSDRHTAQRTHTRSTPKTGRKTKSKGQLMCFFPT